MFFYLMESVDGMKTGESLPHGLSDEVRDRSIIRRVRQALDGWVRMEGRQKTDSAGSLLKSQNLNQSRELRSYRRPPTLQVTGVI